MVMKSPYKFGAAITIGGAIGFLSNLLMLPEISHYEINSKKLPESFDGIKIIHLSDLHNEVFGENNRGLIRRIYDENPDIVVITGDMVSHTNANVSEYIELCRNLAKKYPVYYVNGNHEKSDLAPGVFDFLNNELESAGLICLDNRKTEFKINGDAITMCGLCYSAEYYKGVREYAKVYKPFTPGAMRKHLGRLPENRLVLLLAHNPLDFDVYAYWGADITFSGHVHGGFIRLPFVKGILSPERGLLPKYKEGVYTVKGKKLVVSRGLGSVRIFNRPEIVTVTLHRKDG